MKIHPSIFRKEVANKHDAAPCLGVVKHVIMRETV